MAQDYLKQEIKVDDIIVYGRMNGYSAVINIARVLSVNIKGHMTVDALNCSKKVTLYYPDRCIVLKPESLPQKYLDLLDEGQIEENKESDNG